MAANTIKQLAAKTINANLFLKKGDFICA